MLFDVRKLMTYSKPAHASAQQNTFDFGAYLSNAESSLGVDPNLRRLTNRDDLQLLPELPMRAYFGLLHAHTFASDGLGDARTAMITARDVARLDFFAVTDHSEYWWRRSDATFAEQSQIAREESRDHFVGLVGFEYSNLAQGHVVVLNSTDWTNAWQKRTLEQFFDWLAEPQQSDAIAIFAHPGFHKYRDWFDLAHFQMDGRLQKQFVGVEFIHRNVWRRAMRGYSGHRSFLDEALDQGWHVGPVASQDNHTAFWGVSDGNRLALLLKGLSRADVLEALKARRFYSTQSPQLQMSVGLYSGNSLLATLGDRINASSIKLSESTLRVRFLEPNSNSVPYRLEVLLNGEPVRSLAFLDSSSGRDFSELGDLKSELHTQGRGAVTRDPWWTSLLNNGLVTGKPLSWLFEKQSHVEPEIFDVSVPISWSGCAEVTNAKQKNWTIGVRYFQGAEGDKLTVTSPIIVQCSASPALPK